MNKKNIVKLLVIILLIVLCIFAFSKLSQKENNQETSTEVIGEKKSENIEKKEQPELPKKEDIHIKMSVIGDIMCHNSQYQDAYISASKTYDFSYVFEDIKDHISTADIAIGNLETTFAGKERGYSNYPCFNTPEQLATNLKEFGIDVVSTANNHCMDTQNKGLVSTLNYLDEAGISHTGTSRSEEEQNKILIKDVKGIKIAFLAFTYGTNGIPIPKDKTYSVNLIDENLILKQLELAKKESPDLICVSMHWGIEYQTKQNAEQEKLADLLFKNGVDVILGSHPHVLQPMEKREIKLDDGTTKNGFVIYSLGNFMSGQTQKNTRNSVILKLNFTKNGETDKTSIDSVSYIPIYMYKGSSNTRKYKVLDIQKTINNYDSGTNKSIGASAYSTLKSELSVITKTMGENIEF